MAWLEPHDPNDDEGPLGDDGLGDEPIDGVPDSGPYGPGRERSLDGNEPDIDGVPDSDPAKQHAADACLKVYDACSDLADALRRCDECRTLTGAYACQECEDYVGALYSLRLLATSIESTLLRPVEVRKAEERMLKKLIKLEEYRRPITSEILIDSTSAN
jgi:hypothetical protein